MTEWHVCACTACALRGDEILALRHALGAENASRQWLEWHHTTEFSRPFRTTGDDIRLLVRLQPAWGESDGDFQARQKRMRLAQERKHGRRITDLPIPELPDKMPPRPPAPPIFDRRLESA